MVFWHFARMCLGYDMTDVENPGDSIFEEYTYSDLETLVPELQTKVKEQAQQIKEQAQQIKDLKQKIKDFYLHMNLKSVIIDDLITTNLHLNAKLKGED